MNQESFGAFAGATIAPTPTPHDPTGKLAGAPVAPVAPVVETAPVVEAEPVVEPAPEAVVEEVAPKRRKHAPAEDAPTEEAAE